MTPRLLGLSRGRPFSSPLFVFLVPGHGHVGIVTRGEVCPRYLMRRRARRSRGIVRQQCRHGLSARIRAVSLTGVFWFDLSGWRCRPRGRWAVVLIRVKPPWSIPRNVALLTLVDASPTWWWIGQGALHKRRRRPEPLLAGRSRRRRSRRLAFSARLSCRHGILRVSLPSSNSLFTFCLV